MWKKISYIKFCPVNNPSTWVWFSLDFENGLSLSKQLVISLIINIRNGISLFWEKIDKISYFIVDSMKSNIYVNRIRMLEGQFEIFTLICLWEKMAVRYTSLFNKFFFLGDSKTIENETNISTKLVAIY